MFQNNAVQSDAFQQSLTGPAFQSDAFQLNAFKAAVPGIAFQLDAFQLDAFQVGGIGSLNATLGSLTLSSTATLDITGSLTATLGAVTLSSSATLDITGSLSATLGNVTLSAVGELSIEGTLNVTLDSLTAAATGELAISGSLSQTLEDLTAAGAAEITGTSLSGRRIKERKPNRRGKIIVFPDELPPEEPEPVTAPPAPSGPLGIGEAVKALSERLAGLQTEIAQANAVARQRKRQQARIDALKAEIGRVEIELQAAVEAEQAWIARLRDDDEFFLLAA